MAKKKKQNKTKMSKEIENILFGVYEKGVKQEDCDLTEVYEKLIKLLNQNEDEKEKTKQNKD